MFKKILIANRGEIAVRVIRACREMGITAVAVYSEADRDALHVRLADEAYPIGPPPARESYLSIEKIIAVAKKSGAQAIHPGYGFLSENPLLPEACEAAGIVFIGPGAAAMLLMGNKVTARKAMTEAGVPVTPGTDILPEDPANARAIVETVIAEGVAKASGSAGGDVYPILLKAAAGGGGKGMRVVNSAAEFDSAFAQARSEALSSFGDASVYAEKFVTRPRHIEFQIFADTHGNVIHLGERECTIQRRHQKLVEECPSPVVDEATRARIGEMAVRAARAAAYVGAGTCEFLRDESGAFYFMEMNARLQVEHPVTEMVTGLDLVKMQFRIAAGEPLPIRQEDVHLRGWSIECRIFAEDPTKNFMPSPGRIGTLRVPAGPGVRDDGGVYQGYRVPVHYDPMISKLVVWAETRPDAIARMRRALGEYRIEGIRTTIPFHRRVVRHRAFLDGEFDTGFIPTYRDELVPGTAKPSPEAMAGPGGAIPGGGSEAASHARSMADTSFDGPNGGGVLSSAEVAVVAAAIAYFNHAEAGAVGAMDSSPGRRATDDAAHGPTNLARAGGWKLAARLEGLRDR